MTSRVGPREIFSFGILNFLGIRARTVVQLRMDASIEGGIDCCLNSEASGLREWSPMIRWGWV